MKDQINAADMNCIQTGER